MNDLKQFYKTVEELLNGKGLHDLSEFCNERFMSDYVADHDNWNGGIDTYNIEILVSVVLFNKWKSLGDNYVEGLEGNVVECFEQAVRGIDSVRIGNVFIRPNSQVEGMSDNKKEPLSMPLHFEVQHKRGQRSDYLGSVMSPTRFPCFILVFNDNWTDFDYHTWFSLFYFLSPDSKRFIGELKLMHSNSKSTMEELPTEFDEPLDNSFCSLGIGTGYYISLREILKDQMLIKEVLHYLCDCTFDTIIYENHKDEDVFHDSLMRDYSAIEAFNDGQSLVMGIEPNEMYSFSYRYHPVYNAELYADWNVQISYDSLPFMHTIGIIGNNGVGKTQILSKFVNDLLAQNKDNFVKIPHFKNILVICSTPFDCYPNESPELKDIHYRLCCLEQSKTDTIQKLNENISEICKRHNTIENESLIARWRRLLEGYVDKDFAERVVEEVKDNKGEVKFVVKWDAIEDNVKILSSGQLHILSLVTYICSQIHYRSLLIIDEPEVHLHPHITMEFMAMLSNLLTIFKSYAIIATHTPLVVREMASRNVYLIQKIEDGIPQIAPVAFETLGEDLTVLYRNLFGYDEQVSYFKKMVDDLCERGKNREEIVNYFQQTIKLTVNALLIIRDAVEARNNA